MPATFTAQTLHYSEYQISRCLCSSCFRVCLLFFTPMNLLISVCNVGASSAFLSYLQKRWSCSLEYTFRFQIKQCFSELGSHQSGVVLNSINFSFLLHTYLESSVFHSYQKWIDSCAKFVVGCEYIVLFELFFCQWFSTSCLHIRVGELDTSCYICAAAIGAFEWRKLFHL